MTPGTVTICFFPLVMLAVAAPVERLLEAVVERELIMDCRSRCRFRPSVPPGGDAGRYRAKTPANGPAAAAIWIRAI